MDWNQAHATAKISAPAPLKRSATLFRVVGPSARPIRRATYENPFGIGAFDGRGFRELVITEGP